MSLIEATFYPSGLRTGETKVSYNLSANWTTAQLRQEVIDLEKLRKGLYGSSPNAEDASEIVDRIVQRLRPHMPDVDEIAARLRELIAGIDDGKKECPYCGGRFKNMGSHHRWCKPEPEAQG